MASNEWVIDPSIGGKTDLVFSFPTKRAYTGACGVIASPPFGNAGFCSEGAPEAITITAYDREERTAVSDLNFCTAPAPLKTTLDCAVGVYTIYRTNAFSLPNPKSYLPPVGNSGWVRFSFDGNAETRVIRSLAGAKRDGESCGVLSMRGLPVVGFGVQQYTNGNVGGLLSNYGGSFVHKYERSIECK
jgi:hypothetical protein